jgi:hypothetical protein
MASITWLFSGRMDTSDLYFWVSKWSMDFFTPSTPDDRSIINFQNVVVFISGKGVTDKVKIMNEY